MFRVFLTAILSLSHVAALAQAAPAASSPPRYDFRIPSGEVTDIKNRASALTPNYEDRRFEELGGLLARAKNDNVLPNNWAEKPPTLVVYYSDHPEFKEMRKIMKREVREQFAKIYPGVKLKVQFRPVESELSYKAAFARTIAWVNQKRTAARGNKKVQAELDAVEQVANETLEETKSVYDVSVGTSELIKNTVAFGRAGIVFGVRAATTLPTTLAIGGVPLAASLFLMVFDAAAEYFVVRYTQKLQLRFATPPFTTENETVNEAMSIGQNITLNMIFFNVGRSTIMQAIQHVATPMTVPLPDWESMKDIVKWTLGGSFIYVFFNKGYNRAIDKGWVSAAQIDVFLQVPGIGDALSPIENSNPALHGWRPWTLFPQWAVYAAVGLAGYLLPRRADRIIAIDTAIKDLNKSVFPEQPSYASQVYPVRREMDAEDYGRVVNLVHEKEIRRTKKGGKKACQGHLKAKPAEQPADAEETTASEESVG